MEKICINSKNYKLTQDKSYEIIKRETGYVFIENDNGKISKYHSSLFESDDVPVLEEEIISIRTEQDCIDSISNNNNVISYRDLNNDLKMFNSHIVTNCSNPFSCGILRISGMNDTIDNIENFVDTSEFDLILLKRKLFRSSIQSRIEIDATKGMWMCSTNLYNAYEDYYVELNDMSNNNSGWFYNPNSGNQINMWYGLINQ